MIEVENFSDESSDPIVLLLIGNSLKRVHIDAEIDVQTIAELSDPNVTDLTFDGIQVSSFENAEQ